jgi:RNA polymerase sigma-70 factor (ECF subfamily)
MLITSGHLVDAESADRPEDSERIAAPDADSAEDTGTQKWSVLVARIRAGEEGAMEELYRIFSRGIRFYLCRTLGQQEIDDKVHDTFLIVINAIQRGELREPERLMGFVRTIVRRQVAAFIDQAVISRRDVSETEAGNTLADTRFNPERAVIEDQRVELMREVLKDLSDRDREILTRFYLNEQTQEEICEYLGLSETQFRLLKSRAKARFGELGRKKLAQRSLSKLFLRKTAGGST